MKIVDITKEELIKIQFNFSFFPFSQSFYWADIQERMGGKVFLKAFVNKGKIIAPFILIERKLKAQKKYYYIPRGPVFLNLDRDFYSDFFIALKKEFSRESNLVFIRFEPRDDSFLNYWKSNKKNIKKVKDIQPSKTLCLDLNLTEDSLLSEMKQKTRYNIRLSERKGVKVREADISDFNNFWNLISLTAQRDSFSIHKKEYYKNLILYSDKFIRFFEACFEEEVLAVGIFSFYNDTVSYLHGASSNNLRKLMAPYALQWEIIKKAKQEGFKRYDFYGFDDEKWPGVSRFKKGFGGKELYFPGTFDYIFDFKLYFVYNVFRRVRNSLKKIL